MATATAVSRSEVVRRPPPVFKVVAVVGLIVAGMLGPFYISVFLVGIGTTAAVYVLLGYSVATSLWYTGGLNFGVGALAMLAAYVVVIGTQHGWAVWEVELAAILGCGIANVVLAPFYYRLRGIYFAIMTFAVASLAAEVASTLTITGGTGGLPFLPHNGPIPGLASSINRTYYITVGAMIVAALLLKVARGRVVGKRGLALSNDEVLCQSIGVDRRWFQGGASLVAGVLAGFAGTFFVFELGYVSPDEFSLSLSLAALVALIIGGEQYIVAPIVGCIFAVFLPDLLNVSAFWNQVIYAGSLIIVVLLIPGGLISLVTKGGKLSGLFERTGALAERSHLGSVAKRLGGAAPASAARADPMMAAPATGVLGSGGGVGTLTRDASVTTEAGGDDGERPGTDGRAPALVTGASTTARTTTLGTRDNNRAAPSVPAGGDAAVSTVDREFRAEDIVVRYGGVVAVSDVSCVLHPGQVMGLMGPNGSGKTTLVNALSGLVQRDHGRLTLDGESVNRYNVTALARRGLRRTFQGPRSFRWLTVEEHFAAVRPGVSTIPASDQSDFVSEMIELLGMKPVLKEFPANLPYGRQRLLGLTMAVIGLPKYLMLDEPTSGLHESERRLVERVLLELSSRGIGTLVIDHNIQFLTAVAPRSFAMDSGVVIAEGETAEVLASPEVRRVYIGE